MRHSGLLGGAAAACVIGLSSLAYVSTAGATTSAVPTTPAQGSAAPAAAASPAAPVADRTAGSSTSASQGCSLPKSLNQVTCDVFIKHGAARARHGQANRAGADAVISNSLGPADLRAAYGLTSASQTGGAGVTVAIVDAYNDPHIGSDLKAYQDYWDASAGCASSTGIGTGAGCVTVLNQNGATSPLPATATGDNLTWEDEEALDVEMVWATCPNCHIDLIEAKSTSYSDMGTAENTAAKLSKFVSNSWSGEDYPGASTLDNTYFNHPGVATVFASGDYGYGPGYPASSGLVTSVGGTYLTASSNSRGYSEVTWNGQSAGGGTGAGCSAGAGKPSWQTDAGCGNRTQNDVSAVADAPYGIDVYSSSGDCASDGAQAASNDCAVYGTSVATPIITAVYALAGTPEANTYPASYFYQSGHAANLNDVTSGQVGSCESTRIYLCRAVTGYDGPTGWGTPNGTAAFSSTVASDILSVQNPGSYVLTAGTKPTLPAIKVHDSASGQTLTYSAKGLPSGLSINSASGVISGTLPSTSVNNWVTVTVKDTAGASATIGFRISSVKPLTGSYHAGTGEVKLDLGGKCMNDAHNNTAVDAPIEIYPCQVSSSQNWSYAMSPYPGGAGRITIHGKCLAVLGSVNSAGHHKIGLVNCSNAGSDLWVLTGQAGEIVNQGSGQCLTDPNASNVTNTQLTAEPCAGVVNQAWTMPASPITSGIAGKCVALNGNTPQSVTCSTASSQKVTLGLDGSLQINGKCLYKTGSSYNNGTQVGILGCNSSASEIWGITAYGQIENLLSEKCLAIPNNSSSNGAKLAIEDCAGQPGEVWGVS